jgi:hypothetical protein
VTGEARTTSGIILITVPTIRLQRIFSPDVAGDERQRLYGQPVTPELSWRDAHAGVMVILSLLGQGLADGAALPPSLLWLVGIAVPLAAILISSGFFSVLEPGATQVNGAVSLIYAGTLVLAVGVVTLRRWMVALPATELAAPQFF